jgi:hypothetical protein
MNQLLLLIGVGVVIYIMNEKKMFKDVSKTLSSGKNTTMLVLLFCGVILFMCMQKGSVEGLCVGECTDKCSEENLFYMHPAFDVNGPTQPDKDNPGFKVCLRDEMAMGTTLKSALQDWRAPPEDVPPPEGEWQPGAEDAVAADAVDAVAEEELPPQGLTPKELGM